MAHRLQYSIVTFPGKLLLPLTERLEAFEILTFLRVIQIRTQMAKSGPIVILEDDEDDQDILEEIFMKLNVKNKLVWFTTTDDAFKFLQTTSEQPFIIFSDVNLPRQNGIEFKRRIDSDKELRKKSIPFIFYSTSVDQQQVNEAYTHMTVQGFFQKGISYEEIKTDIKVILDYWQACRHPNSK